MHKGWEPDPRPNVTDPQVCFFVFDENGGVSTVLSGAGRDEGLDSGSNPCTPIPTPFSPSPAQHSVLAEQLAAGIHRLKVFSVKEKT